MTLTKPSAKWCPTFFNSPPFRGHFFCKGSRNLSPLTSVAYRIHHIWWRYVFHISAILFLPTAAERRDRCRVLLRTSFSTGGNDGYDSGHEP